MKQGILKTRKCESCGYQVDSRGFWQHEKSCRRATDEKRARMLKVRLARDAVRNRNGQPEGIRRYYKQPAITVDSRRLRLCISVELEKVKELLPFIEIDEVKIA